MLQIFKSFKNLQQIKITINQYFSSLPYPVIKPEIFHTGLFINNDWHKSINGKKFPTINPTTKEIITYIEEGGKEDIDLAVKAAKYAFEIGSPWRRMNALKRGYLINRLANLIERDRCYLASLETLDSGKPFLISHNVDIPLSIRNLRYFSGCADKIYSKAIPIDGNFFSYTRHEPVGVCGQIIPWNYPILMMILKLGPALATGNTIILKPAEQTSLTALYIGQLIKEAGFPEGVVNIIPGYSNTGQYLVSHNQIDKICFSGSTNVGKIIQQKCNETNSKSVNLELNGKSPNIIFSDSNLIDAVKTSHFGLFFNKSQCYSAASRTFVEDKIYDDFVECSAELAKNCIIGDPFELTTQQGPQIDKKHLKKILNLINIGKEEGAKLITGGKRVNGLNGYFIEPTVFANLEDSMRISSEEIYGPVQQIIRFKTLDEVIERSNNNSKYSLVAASVFSKDLDKVNYLIQSLKAGTVWVNTYNIFGTQIPFDGYHMSEYGRENNEYDLQNYTELKRVVVKIHRNESS